ncbi:MAG: radical SAM protein [Clostridia bacterium]
MYSLVPIFVPHLGCKYDCVFCNQRAISGEISEISPEKVQKTLEKVENIQEVAFYGGSFTAICESLQNELLDVALKFTDNIRVSTRPDAINQGILDRLKLKNVKTIELGAQSMCNEVLFASKRGHTSEDIINASELIKKNGFTLGLQMMIGLPEDNYDRLMYTVSEICKIKPHIARIYPVVVIEKTELYDKYKIGEYIPLEIENAVKLTADVLTKLTENNIKVIRVGLNASEDLSNGKAIAGAYHEAFGQLVQSEIYLRKMIALLDDNDCGEVRFGVHKSEVSNAVGQKRRNILYLNEKYNIHIKITICNIEKGDIIKLTDGRKDEI